MLWVRGLIRNGGERGGGGGRGKGKKMIEGLVVQKRDITTNNILFKERS